MDGYGYAKDHSISKTVDILKRIPQEDIYEFIIGYKPVINTYVRSPLRIDGDAGAWFEWGTNGVLFFVDFADVDRIARDCFQVLMDLEQKTLKEAITMIADHFNAYELPIIYPEFSLAKKKITGNHIQRERSSLLETIETEITFKSRVFSQRDKRFWFDRYGVSRKELMEDGVFPITWYRFYSKKKNEWIIIRPQDVAYAYTDFEQEGKVKIYVPFCKNERGKFITNCNENDIGSYKYLPESGDQLIIAKSYKDKRVLSNLGSHVVWFQNEGMIPSDDLLSNMMDRFREIIILFDNDEPGIKASNKVSLAFNRLRQERARTIIIPYSDVKDPSDLKHKYGQQALINFLNSNGIHGNYSRGDTSNMDTPFDTTV